MLWSKDCSTGDGVFTPPPAKAVPKIIENTREPYETVVKPNDEELMAGDATDEFNEIVDQGVVPKILITTCMFNSTRGPAFIEELLSVILNAQYFKIGTHDLKKIEQRVYFAGSCPY